MIISRTPFRISFFGGGTDYPVWYREHGGAVLATSIDKYCYISCRYLPPFFEHKSRIAYSKIETVQSVDEVAHPSARETLKFMGIEEGVEIHHDADLPARTGLGSSSSFTVGLLHALYALKQRMPTKMQLALEAIHVERERIGESVGNQDQVCAAVGGLNKIVFMPSHEIEVQTVIVPSQRLVEFQSHLMLFFTGFSRFASEVAAKQIASTPKKSKELTRMRRMVDEGLGILCEGDLRDFGVLLDESWRLKRSLTDQISTSLIDQMYEAGMSAGALGGKLLGAGGGGFLLLFAKPEDQPRVRERLSKLLHVPFRFESGGSQIIFYDHNAPSWRQPAAAPAAKAKPAKPSPR
jgi:D-glycero-alpha-D-manno-heptose-7-phosphate kinase